MEIKNYMEFVIMIFSNLIDIMKHNGFNAIGLCVKENFPMFSLIMTVDDQNICISHAIKLTY